MQQNCLAAGQTRSPNSFCVFSDLLAVIGPLFCQGWRFRLGNENEMYVVEEREGKRKENIGGKIG